MPEFTKQERKTLRDLATAVYEAEAHEFLRELDAAFARWRAGEIMSSELLGAIHVFHQDQSRELWSRYQTLKDPEIVARGLALHLLAADKVPDSIEIKLRPLVDLFARHHA